MQLRLSWVLTSSGSDTSRQRAWQLLWPSTRGRLSWCCTRHMIYGEKSGLAWSSCGIWWTSSPRKVQERSSCTAFQRSWSLSVSYFWPRLLTPGDWWPGDFLYVPLLPHLKIASSKWPHRLELNITHWCNWCFIISSHLAMKRDFQVTNNSVSSYCAYHEVVALEVFLSFDIICKISLWQSIKQWALC